MQQTVNLWTGWVLFIDIKTAILFEGIDQLSFSVRALEVLFVHIEKM